MHTFLFGLKYWKKYLPLSLLAKLFSLIAILCDLFIPLIDAAFLDYVLAYDPSAPHEGLFALLTEGLGAPGSVALFAHLAILFAAVFLLRVIVLYCKNVTFQWCGLRMECTLREQTYAKLLDLDGETISRYTMGELLTTMNRDTIIFKEMYSRIFMNLFDSVIVIGISCALLAAMDVHLLIIPLCIAPFFVVALCFYLSRSRKLFRAIREGYSAINLDVQENIDAVRIVRSFAAEEREIQKFDRCNGEVYDLSVKQVRLTAK